LKKEAKQDLIMEGTYHVFQAAGLYRQLETGEWERIVPLPVLEGDRQERLLRAALVTYFERRAWPED
jgi:hypothetical protein